MARWLNGIFLAMSLAVCAVASILWVRSYFRTEEVTRTTEVVEERPPHGGSTVKWRVGSSQGGMFVSHQLQRFSSSWDADPGRAVAIDYPTDHPDARSLDAPLERELEAMGWIEAVRPDWRTLGFRYRNGTLSGERLTYAVVPYWLLVLVTAAWPMRVALRRRRRFGGSL